MVKTQKPQSLSFLSLLMGLYIRLTAARNSKGKDLSAICMCVEDFYFLPWACFSSFSRSMLCSCSSVSNETPSWSSRVNGCAICRSQRLASCKPVKRTYRFVRVMFEK